MDDNLVQDSIYTNHFDRDYDDSSRAIAEARAFRAEAKTITLLSLYEQRLQRAILKNLAALKAMQKERKAQAQPASKPAPSLHKPSPQPIEIAVSSPEIGSVYSSPAPPQPVVSGEAENMAA